MRRLGVLFLVLLTACTSAAPATQVAQVATALPPTVVPATPTEAPIATSVPTATYTPVPPTATISASATVTPTAAARSVSERVKLGDITMYYAMHGQGEPLLLLHGGMGSAEYFYEQVPEFAQHYRVITPDSRGQGRTTDSDAPLSYELMMSDTLKLMDYLKIDSAYIVGHSDGAIIGIEMAIHHPERVKALVAAGANTTPDGDKPDFLQYLRDTPSSVLQKEWGYDYLMLSSTPEHLPVIVEKIRKLFLTEPNITADQLSSIKTPTLVFDGENEEYIRIDHVKEIAKAIPNAQLVLMPNAGHEAPVEKPAEFNKIVLDFLASK